jgi:subtilisin family serine protease
MIKPSGIRVVALFTLLALCPIKSATQAYNEYVVTVGNEELRFVAQPEAGYVVKAREKSGGISAPSSTLGLLLTGNAKPIRGLCRRGICVVERQRPAGENEKTVRMLRANSQVEYIAPLFSSNGETVAIIPEIVVRVTPEICHGRTGELQALCQTINLAIKKRMEFTDCEYLLAVQGSDASALFAALEQLNSIDWIEWAAPNVAFQPRLCGQVMPNDERFPLQWHLHNTGQSGGTPDADINAPEAWEITTGDPNIIVAVLDAGIDPNHPDLINNLVAGYDFYEDDDSPDPALDHVLNAHGTMCAGLIAAQGNNEIGVTGVTWNCGIMSIRIDCHGSDGTYYGITEADRATAFRWAADHGAHVLSISWTYSSPTPILHSAIMDITKRGGIGRDGKGCVVVAGVGNDSGPVGWPAKYPEVIAVGATDHDDIRWDYSNYGPELDIVAPSGNHNPPPPHCYLWTTDISGPAGGITHPAYSYKHILDYVHFGGTSGACPVAAGVAALIFSVEPELSTDDVKHFLEQSGKDLGYPGQAGGPEQRLEGRPQRPLDPY